MSAISLLHQQPQAVTVEAHDTSQAQHYDDSKWGVYGR
jgi:hypothetical protein